MINVARLVALPALALALAACGEAEPTPIDELRGTYRGVGIGDSPKEVRRVFGDTDATTSGGPITPRKAGFSELGGPTSMAPSCPPGDPGQVLRYDDVSFLYCQGRVWAFIVAAHGARTRREVALGDDLSSARERYGPKVRCGEAPIGEGGDTFPYCSGQLSRNRWIWFGRDPVESITVSAARIG